MSTIQHQFGQAAIDAVTEFCRADIKDVAALEADEFSHIRDVQLRRALARTFYGARWLYKVGLSLLIDGDEGTAHGRTQLIDYASVCEALLSDCILHGVTRGALIGQGYRTVDCKPPGKVINWNKGSKADKMSKRQFFWLIEVAGEEHIVAPHTKGMLTTLRDLRNTVHITKLAATNTKYYRTLCKSALTTARQTIDATKAWKLAHP